MFRFSILHFLFAMVAGSFSFAAEPMYKMDLNLSLDGGKPFHAQLITKANSKALISQETNGLTTFIEATAKPQMKEGIEILSTDFTVGTIDAQGKRTVRGTPQIVSDDFGTATASTYNTAEQEVMSLSVSWSRVE